MDNTNIPMLNTNSDDFENEFKFNLWSTHSNSDYSNDRNRPYNGQSHTSYGKRGEQEIKGLTMRDIVDCLVKAMLMSSPDSDYLKPEEFIKCWDFSTNPPTPTEYLLNKQKEDKYISTKVETGNWRHQDVYNLDWTNIDPLAIAKNLTCEIEKMMDTYPNILKLDI